MKRRDVLAGLCSVSVIALASCGMPSSPTDNVEAVDGDIRAAFQFIYPMYEIARIAQDRTGAIDGQSGRLNQIAHRAVLMDHTSRQVTGPNNDTIYSSAFLDLAAGPVEIFAPTSTDRYFSIAFMNVLTDNFAYIGTRETQGIGGRYWLAGPGWRGPVPDGVRLIRSDSNDVWMLARILVDGPSDLEAATAFQQQISVSSSLSDGAARPFEVRADGELTARTLLDVCNMMLARSPGATGELARASGFAALGVSAPENLTPEMLARWEAYLPGGLAELREVFIYRDLVIDGWAYQEPGVGDFGTNDRLRSAVALGGIAALGETEAMYFHANLDPSGERLSGEHVYKWHVPAGGVPADAFWSLTMYETFPDGKFFLVENPLNRFSIGDRTEGLVVNPDGSFDIYIQHTPPDDAHLANWLPAPSGTMRLALRAYMPRAELLNREWKVPPLIRTDVPG